MSVITGNQLLRLRIVSPWMSTLGHSSIGNGTALPGMICFAIAHRRRLQTDQRRKDPALGMRAHRRQLHRALVEQDPRTTPRSASDPPPPAPWCNGSAGDAPRPACPPHRDTGPAALRDSGNRTAMPVCTCPQMNMSSVASEIWLLPSRTLARTASMIFSFGKSICGFRSGRQKLAAPSASRGHLDHAEGRALARRQQPVALLGMADLHESRQGFSADAPYGTAPASLPIRCGPPPRNPRPARRSCPSGKSASRPSRRRSP